MPAECPNCEKVFSGRKCPSCGYSPQATTKAQAAGRCPYDGATLEADGICELGGGYPVGKACHFACPICRGPLDWSGGCAQCHGSKTGKREDWTFPGDGYYTHEVDGKPIGDGQHWVRQSKGPRPACTQAENVAGAREIRRILGARFT